jgi:type VI protein secretion system component Hcp
MRRFLLFAAIVLGFLTAPALADGSFVKIGDIKGTATEAQHQGWIPAANWGSENRSWNFSIWPLKYEPARSVFWFEKPTDASSASLYKAMVDRTWYPVAIFDVAVRAESFRTNYHQVRILSIETKGNREKVTLEYKTQHEQTFIPR